MKIMPHKDIATKWELYTPQQQADILSEFRKKFPEDYYCKTTLFEFLNQKLSMEGHSNTGDSNREINRIRKTKS